MLPNVHCKHLEVLEKMATHTNDKKSVDDLVKKEAENDGTTK